MTWRISPLSGKPSCLPSPRRARYRRSWTPATRIAELRSREMRLQEELTEIEKKGVPQLTMENVARVIELWTKIPASKIREEEFKRLSELEDRLKQHIVGQDEAVAAVAAAIRATAWVFLPKHKPVSFIFVGSTGVGKTELVKQLADDLFHAPESLIRLDMSEFMEKHSVSRIVGSPRAMWAMMRRAS